MDVSIIRELAHNDHQADVVIETTTRLGCWPDDVLIEADAFDAPAGYLVVVAGVKKGKPHTLSVAPDGEVRVEC